VITLYNGEMQEIDTQKPNEFRRVTFPKHAITVVVDDMFLNRSESEYRGVREKSAQQMRRVIVDQIEALAELNRIVARHGRSLDAVEPMRRPAREEPTLAVIGGAVLATLGLGDGLAIRISATVGDTGLRTIEVAQDTVQVGHAVGGRFLDGSWTDRPGGWTASLGATVAKSVAHQAGGEVVFLGGDRRGSTVRFTYSR